MTPNSFKGTILSISSDVRQKENGKNYLIGTAEINVNGKTLRPTFQYTLEDKDGKMKEPLEIGQEVILYHTAVPSTKPEGGVQHFFEVSRGVISSSNEEISDVLGSMETAPETADVAKEAVKN